MPDLGKIAPSGEVGRVTSNKEEMKELNLNQESKFDPSIDYTDGGDFAVSYHIADILDSEVVMRSHMNLLIICTRGSATVELHGRRLTVGANEVLICPSHIMLGNFAGDGDFVATTLCLSDRLLYAAMNDKVETWLRMVYVDDVVIHQLSEKERQRLELYSKLARSVMGDPEVVYRDDLVLKQIEAFVLELCGKFWKRYAHRPPTENYSKNVFFRFLKLLTGASVKRKNVADYAKELSVSPKYLSYVCDRFSGRTALEWVDKFVMEDVRYYLKSTDYSVKEVSSILGFNNNSFFGRYVLRHVGMSPLAYRRLLKK